MNIIICRRKFTMSDINFKNYEIETFEKFIDDNIFLVNENKDDFNGKI